jgi:transposase
MNVAIRMYRAQRRRVEKRLRHTRCRIEALRCRILLLLDARKSVVSVAAIAGCVRATVYRTVYRFEDLDEDALVDRRYESLPRKVPVDGRRRLLSYLDENPRKYGWQRATWTLELLALQLEADTRVRLSRSHVRNLLRAEGCRRGRPRQALRIPVRGRRRVLDGISALVAKASAAEEVFYSDEADVDLNPRIGFAYMRRGQQPLVLTPGKNVKRYLAGALNARTGALTYVDGERKNSALFTDLLDAIQRRYRRARRLHLIVDNCVVHKSRQTREYLSRGGVRITLHFLPPYSPESNVIERLWKQLHDHVTRNHQHPNMGELMLAVDDFLAAAQPFPGAKASTARIGLLA